MDFINFPQSGHQNFTVTSSGLSDICVCCLTRDGSFVNLISCKHTAFFTCIPNFVINFSYKVVCRECHEMLRKFTLFKEQVYENLKLLRSQSLNIKTNKKTCTLKLSPIELSHAVNSDPLLFEVKVGVPKLEQVYEVNVVKNEPESDGSDLENNLPLYQMKKEEVKLYRTIAKTRKKIEIPKKMKKQPRPAVVLEKVATKYNMSAGQGQWMEGNLEGKIRQVSLTEDDATLERDRSKKEEQPKSAVVLKKVAKPVLTYNMCVGQGEWQEGTLEGKIREVALTKDEVTLEREGERKKPSYESLPFKCESCIVAFNYKWTYKDHIEKRHTEKPSSFKCDICKTILGTEYSYKQHYQRHFKRYECMVCGRRNVTLRAVMKHYSDTHELLNEFYECKDCEYATENYRKFRYHRSQHKGSNHCTECGKIYRCSYTLRIHMRTHNATKHYLPCKLCDKKYLTKKGLESHTESVHNKSRPRAYCPDCQTCYSSKTALYVHYRMHSAHITEESKKYACDVCGARFLQKGAMRDHIQFLHMRAPRTPCPHCDKSFTSKIRLKKHVDYVHKKIRPPKNKICDHCGKGFTTLQILTAHVRTHTGERPLSCTECTATFAHKAALYTHNKLIHLKKRKDKADG